MEYRGVRYAIRLGIARGQWQVAVYLPDKELPKETTVLGARQNAEIAATSIIDAWLKKRSHKQGSPPTSPSCRSYCGRLGQAKANSRWRPRESAGS